MSKTTSFTCAAFFGLCLVVAGLFTLSVYLPTSPPSTASAAGDLSRNYTREYDGFPVATSLGQHVVNECSRVHHVNPFGTITLKQAEDVALCVALIRSGRVTLN